MEGFILDEFNKIFAWVIFGILSLLTIILVVFLHDRIEKSSAILLALSLTSSLIRCLTYDLESNPKELNWAEIWFTTAGPLAASLFSLSIFFFIFEMKDITNLLQSTSP